MKWNYLLFLLIFLCINKEIKTINKKFLTTILLKEKFYSSKLVLTKLTIDNDHQLRDYFPYFLQTHILKTNNLYLNKKDHSTDCIENYCEFCDKSTRKTCLQCIKGFYKQMGKCLNTCPKNYVADIFKRECHQLNEKSNKNTLTVQMFWLRSPM